MSKDTPHYTAADFSNAQKGDELAITAISSKGNAVERFGEIDTIHSDGVTVRLSDRDKPTVRRIRFDQITYLLFL